MGLEVSGSVRILLRHQRKPWLNAKPLVCVCPQHRSYWSAPELNDVLHLQCKGITKLENLDVSAVLWVHECCPRPWALTSARPTSTQEYTGLKTLYLEQNAIARIENLEPLVNLRGLYLAKNMLEDISGLSTLVQLDSLDLSDNYITTVSGLDALPALRTLNLSGNKLSGADSIAHLQQCTSITSLDLSNNRIDDAAAIDLVLSMQQLSYLRLMGNPVVSTSRWGG